MSNRPTVGSLFAGIGGFDLGFERAGYNILWQVEKDLFNQRILKKHYPDAVLYGDIRDVDFNQVEPVDVLVGGFPCQDISSAGKKKGIRGEKSGLWSEYFRAIRTIRPRFAVIENVGNVAIRGLDVVLCDLAGVGYNATWETISAAAFGAPHLRQRTFVVAYPDGESGSEFDVWSETRREIQQGEHISRRCISAWVETGQPDIRSMDDGVSPGLDRLRNYSIGNAVIPQITEYIGEKLIQWI